MEHIVSKKNNFYSCSPGDPRNWEFFALYFITILYWELVNDVEPGPEVIKLFSCSTQLSMKFQLLIKSKIPTNEDVSCFKSLRCCISHANKC